MTLISDLLDAMPDPAAVNEHWRRICREMVTASAASEYERGQVDGYLLAVADIKAAQHGAVRNAQLERRRWHACCRRCRLNRHRDGCRDCEDRTRETFAAPMSGDYPGGPVAWLPGWVPGSGEPPALEAAS
jgi:hypothetical protein